MRLGLFGGTFNPIHLGHLILAECARAQYRLDQVWFIPTAVPPHKTTRDLLDGRQRLRLIRLAIRGHAAFRACDVELAREGASYTVDTVRAIHAARPSDRLFWLVGSDVLQVRWRSAPELQRRCTFLVAGRAFSASRRRGWRVQRIQMPQIDISSSMIRARLRAGTSIRYVVPPAVERALLRQRFYRRPLRRTR